MKVIVLVAFLALAINGAFAVEVNKQHHHGTSHHHKHHHNAESSLDDNGNIIVEATRVADDKHTVATDDSVDDVVAENVNTNKDSVTVEDASNVEDEADSLPVNQTLNEDDMKIIGDIRNRLTEIKTDNEKSILSKLTVDLDKVARNITDIKNKAKKEELEEEAQLEDGALHELATLSKSGERMKEPSSSSPSTSTSTTISLTPSPSFSASTSFTSSQSVSAQVSLSSSASASSSASTSLSASATTSLSASVSFVPAPATLVGQTIGATGSINDAEFVAGMTGATGATGATGTAVFSVLGATASVHHGIAGPQTNSDSFF